MKIKQFRNNSTEKLTQKDMAKILQLSERQYRRIECGKSLPDVRTAIRISKTLNTTVENLWGSNPTK